MAKVAQLENVSIITNDMFEDERGQLFTLWQKSDTPLLSFNHDKVAVSKENVLRGLHTDKSWKLITCLHGKIQLVVVNFHNHSNKYLNYLSIVLDSKSEIKTSVLVPPGFLNGHLVLSDQAIFHYKWAYDGEYPDVKDQTSVNWADPKINIDWAIKNPILSERDRSTPLL